MKASTRKILIISPLALIVCAIIGLLLWYVLSYNMYADDIQKEIALFIAEGGSLDVSDLAPKDSPELRENAERFMRAGENINFYNEMLAGESIGRIDFTSTNIPEEKIIQRAIWEFDMMEGINMEGDKREPSDYCFEWNDEWVYFLERYLNDERATLEDIKQAAEFGKAYFDVNWNYSASRDINRISAIRQMANFLSFEAVFLAKRGDAAGAMENVRLTFRLRRLFDDEPWIMSKLLNYVIDHIACEALHKVLSFTSPDRESVDKLLLELSDHEELNRLTHALLGLTAMSLQHFEVVGDNPAQFKQDYPGRLPRRFSHADRLHYLRWMRFFRAASRKHFPDALDDKDVQRLRNYFGDEANKKRFFYTALDIEPNYRCLEAQANSNARIRMARLALALSLYRKDKGEYPDSLDVLVSEYLPEVQTDPFDGRPIRYIRKGEGYVLYSVGENRIDNKGFWFSDINFETGVETTGDIPWATVEHVREEMQQLQ